jgi:NADP-dependent 3-hydroxy acid dehydrogenase YdfG
MSARISKQVVVVTGAAHGVGRAIARAFGARGAKVGLIARGEEGLWGAQREIEASGGEAIVLPLDVSDADAVEAAAEQVERRWGRIDTWVNDAMVSVFSPVAEMSPDEYRRVTEVAYLGTVYGTLAALRRMRARDSGIVIQIGSALAYRSIPLQSAYCASKAAIRGFTDSLRSELIHDKSRVRVSMLQLPAVNTPQFDVVRTRLPRLPQPVPPIYQPEVIAKAVLYAARHAPREMVLGVSAWKAILGQKLIPGLLDHYLARVGYGGQQTSQPVSAQRRRTDNLDKPLPGDLGAHGDFDARARRRSTEIWMRRHPKLLASVAGLTAIGLLLRSQARHA